jgi:hypothetical protein
MYVIVFDPVHRTHPFLELCQVLKVDIIGLVIPFPIKACHNQYGIVKIFDNSDCPGNIPISHVDISVSDSWIVGRDPVDTYTHRTGDNSVTQRARSGQRYYLLQSVSAAQNMIARIG